MVGDAGVGKTNILLRYMSNEYEKHSKATLGVEFSSKYLKMEDDSTVRAQLWDTAGDERHYAPVANLYLKGAVGALLVYDITSRASFENIQAWLNRLLNDGREGIVVMLVGNKIDLSAERQVTSAEGQQFAMENDLAFMEVSALAGKNIELAFKTIITRKYFKTDINIEIHEEMV